MSNLLVPVALIEKLAPHPNADALELAQVLGWQIVVKKDAYHVGQKVVYFPIDAILPLEISERFGVTKYLSKQRIRCAKLRGEPSFGLVVEPDDENWTIGQNMAEYYGATRYEPPVRPEAGDMEKDHPLFQEYTEIENLRNYPDIFTPGEAVVLTEKVHGTNCRVGMIEGEMMAGSKSLRRKRPENEQFARNIYWFPFHLAPVRSLLEELGSSHQQVILYGEVYGSKIQSLHYGLKERLGFRAFDLCIDGRYQDWPDFLALCQRYGVETVPIVAEIPFQMEEIKRLSNGPTLIMAQDAHLREGLVVKPVHEYSHPELGRVILKYVSDDYLFSKNTDYTDR
ncbi:RNA ligase (ATP) [Ktedonosporobacter rubrisoli]|uniref:RNA ligase (ATP) n=1 Tax=Ktedonosporobacter rubrisoli TaxID=2509675 RepID=UPI0013EED706|nr:RNA ligase (ATP) [Ktedonosporobacter rubrisoli]